MIKKLFLLLILSFLLLHCSSTGNTGSGDDTGNGGSEDGEGTHNFTDSFFKPKLANKDDNIKCEAGDYDSNFDGIKDFTIECYSSGHRKKHIAYHSNVNKASITYYNTNGTIASIVYYYTNGTTASIIYYNTNGNEDSSIRYNRNGNKASSIYYHTNGNFASIIYYHPNGNKNYIVYYNTNNTTERYDTYSTTDDNYLCSRIFYTAVCTNPNVNYQADGSVCTTGSDCGCPSSSTATVCTVD